MFERSGLSLVETEQQKRNIISSVVFSVFAEVFSKNIGEFTENTRLAEDLNADALDLMDLIFVFSEKGYTIPEEKIEEFLTLGDFISFLCLQ